MNWICRYRYAHCSLAIAFFMVLGLEGASGQQSSPNVQVIKPSNHLALAGNIKDLLRSRRLLDRQFYTESNFIRTFGGSSVRWTSNDSARIFATVLGYPGESIDVYWQDMTNNNTRRGGIITGPMRLTAIEIISVFGLDFKVEDPYEHDNPRHPTPLLPATSEAGNKRYSYHENDGKTTSDVSVLFASDGSIQRINAWQEKNK